MDEEYDDLDSRVCPECGSDDLRIAGEDDDGEDLFECLDCGEVFSEEDAAE